MFKPTLYEETHPSSVDFRVQRYNKKSKYANIFGLFSKIIYYVPTFHTVGPSGSVFNVPKRGRLICTADAFSNKCFQLGFRR